MQADLRVGFLLCAPAGVCDNSAMLPASLIASALSRLLSHDDAARKLLSAHANETLLVRMPPFVTALQVTPAGDFVAAARDLDASDASVCVDFALASLPLFAQGREAALRSAKVSGKAALLQDVSKALSSLPLGAEAELERLVGPILAHEAVRFVRALKSLGDNAQQSLDAAGKRYLHDEAQLVVSAQDIERFGSDVQRARIDLDRLAARIARLG